MYLLYFVVWIIFNGRITLEICLFGLVIAALMFAFTCRFMDYSIAKEKRLLRSVFKFIRYACVLVREIVKANFAVMHMILSEREELQPTLVSFHSDMKTVFGRTFLANAITLTPGTITVSLEGSDYVVHCLDEDLGEGIDRSVFVEMLKEMEQDPDSSDGNAASQQKGEI